MPEIETRYRNDIGFQQEDATCFNDIMVLLGEHFNERLISERRRTPILVIQ